MIWEKIAGENQNVPGRKFSTAEHAVAVGGDHKLHRLCVLAGSGTSIFAIQLTAETAETEVRALSRAGRTQGALDWPITSIVPEG
jgi:hypothetical protein